jgi:hypothetical protein
MWVQSRTLTGYLTRPDARCSRGGLRGRRVRPVLRRVDHGHPFSTLRLESFVLWGAMTCIPLCSANERSAG